MQTRSAGDNAAGNAAIPCNESQLQPTHKCVASELGFLFPGYKQLQKLHTILYTLPYLGFHASCRPSSGLKSRVWPLRLLVFFTVIARPELRFHNHLLISTAWIKGQPDVSLTRLQKRDGTARCVRVITNKEAASPRTYRQSPSLWSHLLSSLLCICPCRLSSNCHLRCTSCTRS